MADIDLVVSELRRVLEARKGRWPNTLRNASRLLEDPRYQASDDATAALATDLTAAIARLPTPLRHDADVLLDITGPRSMGERWRAVGAEGYSGDARRCHAGAIFTRVAVELLGLWSKSTDERSYKILTTDIKVFVNPRLARWGHHDYIQVHFSWTIEPLISDLLFFSFRHQLDADYMRIDACALYKASAHLSEAGYNHWYGLCLHQPPSLGVPVEITAVIEYEKHNPTMRREVSYIPPDPLKELSIVMIHRDARFGSSRCVERTGPVAKVARWFDGTVSGTATHYHIASPRTDCQYALEW